MREFVFSGSERRIRIPAVFFEDCPRRSGRDLLFLLRDGFWEVTDREVRRTSDSNPDLRARDSEEGADHRLLAVFPNGEYTNLDFGQSGSISAVIREYTPEAFVEYKLSDRVAAGRGTDNDILLSFSRNVSRRHMEIFCRDDGRRIIRNYGSNGLYVNGIRCPDECEPEYGDYIEIFGFHMIFFADTIACQKHQGVQISLQPAAGHPDKRHGRMESPAKIYHRSPRDLQNIPTETVVVEKPPDIHSEYKESWLNLTGPMFTMMIPMISGSLFMLYAAKSSGAELTLSLYSGIVMAVLSGLCSIIWGLISRLLSRRDRRKEGEELTSRYMDYLIRINQRISTAYEDYRKALVAGAPGVMSLSKIDASSPDLWNRNPYDKDFLQCRIGIGNLPYPTEIRIPPEDFNNYGRDLWIELSEMSERYKTVYKVPILADLLSKRQIGFSGTKAEDRMAFLRTLTVQLAASHCYTEVKLVYIYNRDKSLPFDGTDSLRWLPHVYDRGKTERYIASTREETAELFRKLEKIFQERERRNGAGEEWALNEAHYIVFILEPEYTEGELFTRFFDEHRTAASGEKKGGPGLSGVWIVPERDGLPNSCSYIIERNEMFQGINPTDAAGRERQELIFDYISGEDFDRFARRIANIRVAEPEVSEEIPDMLSFFELYHVEEVSDLSIGERWKRNRAYDGLRAYIGYQAGGKTCVLDISEKSHGPHGLVAGTTGSGKSEMLQTFLLSLAVNYSPEDVNFFLIDYKGGGMADLLEGLPHLCGRISNLSEGLVKRAMMSIKSENQRRQRLFKEYKVNNINDYQGLYYEGEISEVLPHLVIVIDEFAELKKEEPDFMRELISVAQVGRSLGLHLILATQKPGGTVDDKIWSNARFRICLRVQDKQDSMEMLKRADAASVTVPGRGFIQVGNNEMYKMFQSGWSGAPAMKTAHKKRAAYPVFPNGKRNERAAAGKSNVQKKEKISQLEAVRDHISAVAESEGYERGRGLWMEPLSPLIGLKGILDREEAGQACADPKAIIGIFDDPENQKQPLFEVSFDHSGHVLVCGISMSGKSCVIQTILYSSCLLSPPEQLQIYGVDYGGGMMRAFRHMPHTGMIAGEGEEEKIRRLFSFLDRKLSERKKLLGGGNFLRYRKMHPERKDLPLILAVFDNYPALREDTDGKYEGVLWRLAREGERTGILLIVGGSEISVSDIPSSFANQFKTKICLEQKETYGFAQLLGTIRIPNILPHAEPGRGIAFCEERPLEFRTALCIPDPDDYARMEYIESEGLCLREDASLIAENILTIPEQVSEENVRAEMQRLREAGADKSVLVGYSDTDAKAFTLPVSSVYCFHIVAERKEDKDSVMRMILLSLYREDEVEVIVIDPDGQICGPPSSSEYGMTPFKPPAGAGMVCLSEDEEIVSFFRKLVPLIRARAGKGSEGENGHEGEAAFEADDGKQLVICIADMKSFLSLTGEERFQLSGFFDNIWSKGSGLGITFIAVTMVQDLPEARLLDGFDAFCRYGTGMQIGGVLEDARAFNLSEIDFRSRTGPGEKGKGYIFLQDKKPEKIVVPAAKDRSLSSKGLSKGE